MNNITYTVPETHIHSLDIHNFFENLRNPKGIIAEHTAEPTEWAGITYIVPTTHVHAEAIYDFMGSLKYGTGLSMSVNIDPDNLSSVNTKKDDTTSENITSIPELPEDENTLVKQMADLAFVMFALQEAMTPRAFIELRAEFASARIANNNDEALQIIANKARSFDFID